MVATTGPATADGPDHGPVVYDFLVTPIEGAVEE